MADFLAKVFAYTRAGLNNVVVPKFVLQNLPLLLQWLKRVND